MQIALFGTKPYDRRFFDAANADYGFSIQYLEPRLTPQTLPLAQGMPVVCVFVNDNLSAEVIAGLAAGGTRMIALRCAGFNNVDLEAAQAHGFTVSRVPAYSPYAVAEHTLALALTLNRKTHKAYNRVREGNFTLDGLVGFDLHGKTVGIIGTGKIGTLAARAFHGLGCRVLGFDHRTNPDAVALGVEYQPLEQLLAESDIISLHCPLTPESRHLVNDRTIARMKPGVMLINTGRGPLIDTAAVIRALKSGHIGYLGLDVYEEEEGVFFEDRSASGLTDDKLARLLSFPNVLITGHQAFLTREALTAIAEVTLANIARFRDGVSCPNRLPG